MKITQEIRQAAMKYKTDKNNGILAAYRENKQLEALAQQDVRAKMSPLQQLEVLDARLGKGVGAKKERKRLLKQLKKEKPKNV